MIICVLYGGISSEREVSLKSGIGILESLQKEFKAYGYDFNGNFKDLYENLQKADIVFNALHGGAGENGTLQLFFEENNIAFTGSNSESSKIAMNKLRSKIICDENSILTPDWIVYGEDLNKIEKFNNKSIVVKPADDGSSMGLSIIENFNVNVKEKIDLLDNAIVKSKNISKNILIEEYIAGKELTISILDNKALPAVEIKPKNILYDYECKYKKGNSDYIVPADLNKTILEQLDQISLKIFNLLGCRHYGRADYRLSLDNQIYFLELNTLPGFTETSLFPKAAAAADICYDDLIITIVKQLKK
jgi:D-alanine-D-alanine ligase